MSGLFKLSSWEGVELRDGRESAFEWGLGHLILRVTFFVCERKTPSAFSADTDSFCLANLVSAYGLSCRGDVSQGTVRRKPSQLPLDNLLRILRHVVNDRLHTDFYAAAGFRGIEITKLKKQCSGRFNDFLGWRIRWLIHAAFIAR